MSEQLHPRVQARTASGKVANTAHAHQREGDPPEEPVAVGFDLVPQQRHRRTNQEHGQHEPAHAQDQLERVEYYVTHRAQGLRVGEQTEQTRDHEQHDPQVTLVASPQAGRYGGRVLSRRRARRGLGG